MVWTLEGAFAEYYPRAVSFRRRSDESDAPSLTLNSAFSSGVISATRGAGGGARGDGPNKSGGGFKHDDAASASHRSGEDESWMTSERSGVTGLRIGRSHRTGRCKSRAA